MSVLAAMAALAVSSGPLLQFAFAVFLQPVSAGLRITTTQASAALAIGMILSGLCTPIAGWLMDRFGIRAVTLPAIPLLAAGLLAIGLVSSGPVTFAMSYAIVGACSAALAPLPFAKSISGRFHKRRGLAIGIAMAGVGVGAALVPQYVQNLISDYGWSAGYLGLALLVMVIALPGAHFGLPRDQLPAARSGHPSNSGLEFGQIWKTKTFAFMLASFFFMALVCNGIVAHLVNYVAGRDGSIRVAIHAISATGLAIIAGRLASGFLLDRLAPHLVAAGFFLLPIFGIVLFVFSDAPGIAAAALVGLGLGAEVDLISYMIGYFFGTKAFGVTFGYQFLAFAVGSAVGPVLLAVISSRYGYDTALTAFGGLLAVGCAFTLRLTEPKYSEPTLKDATC